jgi:hypothetical protein
MAETTLGTCSHPDCNWIGQSVNWKKHKDGCGKEGKRRAGQHEGCMCCRFIPSIAPASETQLSSLQRTLQLLPAFDATTVHKHLRGEFHRRADIDGRWYEAVFTHLLFVLLTHLAVKGSRSWLVKMFSSVTIDLRTNETSLSTPKLLIFMRRLLNAAIS